MNDATIIKSNKRLRRVMRKYLYGNMSYAFRAANKKAAKRQVRRTMRAIRKQIREGSPLT